MPRHIDNFLKNLINVLTKANKKFMDSNNS